MFTLILVTALRTSIYNRPILNLINAEKERLSHQKLNIKMSVV